MNDNTALLAAMQDLLQQASTNPATGAETTAWNAPQSAPSSAIQGVGVPIKISRGNGTLKLLLWLPAACAASPQAMNAALDQLERMGLPLDVWESRSSGWGSSSTTRNWRR